MSQRLNLKKEIMFLVIFCIYMGLRSFGKEVETLRHLTRNQPAIIDDMAETVKKQRDRPRVSEAREERDLAIYKSHMRGNSIRAIQEEFQIKSTKTVWSAVNRGKELVKEQRIDLEVRRIEIDELFANTLGHLAGEVARQTDGDTLLRLSATMVPRRSGTAASTPHCRRGLVLAIGLFAVTTVLTVAIRR